MTSVMYLQIQSVVESIRNIGDDSSFCDLTETQKRLLAMAEDCLHLILEVENYDI